MTEILRYFDAHPHAADSVPGIAKWWLSRRAYEKSVGLVQEAVDGLVAKGLVTRRELSDGTQIYSVKQQE